MFVPNAEHFQARHHTVISMHRKVAKTTLEAGSHDDQSRNEHGCVNFIRMAHDH